MADNVTPAGQPVGQDHVLVLCHMLSKRIGNDFGPALGKLGLSVAEWRVLLTLASHGGTNGQEIARRWATNKMTVSRAIDGLRRRGLIERNRNTSDKRVVDVEMTAAGLELFEQMVPIANQRYRELMVSLSASETDRLHEFLLKVIAQADAISD